MSANRNTLIKFENPLMVKFANDFKGACIKNSNAPLFSLHLDNIYPRECFALLVICMHIYDIPFDEVMLVTEFNIDSPIINSGEVDNFLVLFKQKSARDIFKKWYKENGLDENILLPTLPSSSKPLIPVQYIESLNAYDHIENHYYISQDKFDAIVWLYKNCKKQFYVYGDFVFFEDEEEATLFKLKFV